MSPAAGADGASAADTGLLLGSGDGCDRGGSGHSWLADLRRSFAINSGRRIAAALLIPTVCLGVIAAAVTALPRRAGLSLRGRPGSVIERPELFSGDFGVAGAAGDPCMSSAERSQRWNHLGSFGSHEGGAPWQIVYPGLMNVRSGKHYLSRMIGMKTTCLMVFGRREGNWVRLLGEPGYMMIELNGTTLMEESPVSYRIVEQGSCADARLHPITDLDTCGAAARALGLQEVTARHQTSSGHLAGCYMSGSSLFLSTNPENAGYSADGARQLLCSSSVRARKDPCARRQVGLPHGRRHGHSSTERDARAEPSGRERLRLLCFTVVKPAGKGMELMVAQIENHAGVFSCDESIVYSLGVKMPLTPGWNTTMIPIPQDVSSQTELETLSYMEAWNSLLQNHKYHNSDWVVKVAPDTVFFASRLREKLHSRSAPEGKSIFFLNCRKSEGGEPALLGSVEVFSRGAAEIYRKGRDKCKEDLPWQSWGENTYIQQCLELLGVGSVLDGDMVADSRCEPAPCSDMSKVAFHDYRNASSYLECWEEATEVSMAAEFMRGISAGSP